MGGSFNVFITFFNVPIIIIVVISIMELCSFCNEHFIAVSGKEFCQKN